MAFQIVLIAAFVAVAQAGIVPAGQVAYAAGVDTDYDPNPAYSYAYDVQDALTGDSKNQQESRQGDVVQGSYSLVEPDGTRRTVEYTADPINGFNAVVHREPLGHAIAKTVVAAPAYAHAAPLGYAAHAAPIGYASHAAPLAYASHASPLAYGASAYGSPLGYAPSAYSAGYAPSAYSRTILG